MKKIILHIAGILFSCFIMSLSCITAYATTVEDVIAYARQMGMPEDEIQGYINQFGSGTYTSEQCDKAIALLSTYTPPSDTSAAESIPIDISKPLNTEAVSQTLPAESEIPSYTKITSESTSVSEQSDIISDTSQITETSIPEYSSAETSENIFTSVSEEYEKPSEQNSNMILYVFIILVISGIIILSVIIYLIKK